MSPSDDSVTDPAPSPIPRHPVERAGGRGGLAHLADLHDERHALEGQIAELVQQLAAAGVSWGAIGRALGISRQGARQRYG